MAANGASAPIQAQAPVLAALKTMSSNEDRARKNQAHEFLEKFQKSNEAWTMTFSILNSADATPDAKLFAATTLKGKETIQQLRDSLLTLLSTYSAGPKPIRTQLCVCLANLAIQMVEWKDVLQLVISKLSSEPACILKFFQVLPEEVTEGRKINLAEDDLILRTKELLEDNAVQVIPLLEQYAQSSDSARKDPQLFDCISSWLREVPIDVIVKSPLLEIIFQGLNYDESMYSAVECVSAILGETRDVDESLDIVKILYPAILALKPKVVESLVDENIEAFKCITRIFAEAGEAWVVLIARMPDQFRSLVEAVLDCAARDEEHDVVGMTFNFWYELKQYLTLDKYMEARMQYVDIYAKLVDVMIKHLEYPKPESGDENDLFDGDRMQEEKFREFRHAMGDVLKDCCEVIGVTECLNKTFQLIQQWIGKNGSQAKDGEIPDWQKLEAPLFSLRAMGRRVPPDESIILPRLMPLIVQIPDHEKVRFQAVMAIGRYTEWTAKHPEALQPQFDFIRAAFNHPSKEVVRAAALSFKFFCNDCAELLKDYTPQLQQFYESVLDQLPPVSQEELTDGVASVIARQPQNQIYQNLKIFCDPITRRLMAMAEHAQTDEEREAVADTVQLFTIFVQWVRFSSDDQNEPSVKFCQEIFPILAAVVDKFNDSVPVSERVCRCWRYMVLSYRTAITPLLPDLATKLASGFAESRQGCFLWASDAIIREFSGDVHNIDEATLQAIFNFYEQQATTFLRALNDLKPEELPDVIEDFFRLSIDVINFYPHKAIPSALMPSIISAAITSLTLLKEEPLRATLHFLRDFLAYGEEDLPTSTLDFDDTNSSERLKNPPEIQNAVKQLIVINGEALVQRVMTGMMYSFPRDCFPDASGVLLALFQLLPDQTALWVRGTVELLPTGSVSAPEAERLWTNIQQRVQTGEIRKIRTLMQDFTNSYRRRNVAPREGLGRLEATKFKFTG